MPITRLFKTFRPQLIAASALCAAMGAPGALAQAYYATPVASLGGSSSAALAVNNAGAVAGNATISGNTQTHAIVFSRGQSKDLGVLGNTNSYANGLNDLGTVVGNSNLVPTATASVTHAFSYSAGTMVDLGTLGGATSFALAVNNNGVIVGFSDAADMVSTHAFSYFGGKMTDLGTLGGSNSKAYAVNASGLIVGNADLTPGSTNHHAALFSGGKATDLGTLGGSRSTALAINSAGVIVGDAQDASNRFRAFLYSNGAMTNLGSLSATDTASYAYGINDSGTVVGFSIAFDGTNRAWVYQNGAMTDLNSLVNLPGVSLQSAEGINALGQIVAEGSDGKGYLLTPSGLHLAIAAPASVYAGVAATFTVAVLDGSNNPATGYAASLSLSSSDAGATLPASVSLVGGTGTFTVTFSSSGSQSVSGADTEIGQVQGSSVVSVQSASAPTLLAQPQSQSVNLGANAAFWVQAAGTPPLTYQWYFNGVAISGANRALLQAVSVTSYSAGDYSVVVSGPGGSTQSANASLSVESYNTSNPVSWVTQPLSQTAALGTSVAFTAVAQGPAGSNWQSTSQVTYQWFQDGTPIPGATSSTYLLSGASLASAGTYLCVASDTSGSLFSQPAILAIDPTAVPGRITNMSCRGMVAPGAQQLIVGFVLGGSGASGYEPMLLRSSGPALASLGVSGTLADPVLTLNSSAGVVASNAGWAGSSQISAAAASVGAFPWTNPSSLDSALLQSLPSGSYTAQIFGASQDQGVALAEIYDATAGYPALNAPRVVNISARDQVGTGSNVLIAGFVIDGTTEKTVLVRASGPALKPFGVSGVLADPALALYRSNSDGTTSLMASNTGWNGVYTIATTAASLGAFSWGLVSTQDSAVLVSLPPGVYTAQVSGSSGDTGIALVEVYEIY